MPRDRHHLLWDVVRTGAWPCGAEVPRVVVVLQNAPEVRVAVWDDDLEAGSLTPLQAIRRVVEEADGEIEAAGYTPRRHVATVASGQWSFLTRSGGVVAREDEASVCFTRHVFRTARADPSHKSLRRRGRWHAAFTTFAPLVGAPQFPARKVVCDGYRSAPPPHAEPWNLTRAAEERRVRLAGALHAAGVVDPPVLLIVADGDGDGSGTFAAVPSDPDTALSWDGATPLHRAMRRGDAPRAAALLQACRSDAERGVLLHSGTAAGTTALCAAIEHGRGALLATLLASRAVQDVITAHELRCVLYGCVAAGLTDAVAFLTAWSASRGTGVSGAALLKAKGVWGAAFPLPTTLVAQGRSCAVVALLAGLVGYTAPRALEPFFAAQGGRRDVVAAVLGQADVAALAEEPSRLRDAARWHAVTAQLVEDGRADLLEELLSRPATRGVVAACGLSLMQRAVLLRAPRALAPGGRCPPGAAADAILEMLLAAAAPDAPAPLPPALHAPAQKAAVAVAMDLGRADLVRRLVARHGTADALLCGCVLYHCTEARQVISIPPLAYAACLGRRDVVAVLMERAAELGMGEAELLHGTRLRVHTSQLPWDTPPLPHDAMVPLPFPPEVWAIVAAYLPAVALATLGATCRGLADVVADARGSWEAAFDELHAIGRRTAVYLRHKASNVAPIPDPSTLAHPQHVFKHAYRRGVFRLNCRCTVPVTSSELAAPRGEPHGYTTVELAGGVGGLAYAGNFTRLTGSLFHAPARDAASVALDLYERDGRRCHTAVPAGMLPRQCPLLGGGAPPPSAVVQIHPLVLAAELWHPNGASAAPFVASFLRVLRLEAPGAQFGHYLEGDADETLHASLLGAVVLMNRGGRLTVAAGDLGAGLYASVCEEALRVAGGAYLDAPERHRGMDGGLLRHAVAADNAAAVDVVLRAGASWAVPTASALPAAALKSCSDALLHRVFAAVAEGGPAALPKALAAPRAQQLAVMRGGAALDEVVSALGIHAFCDSALETAAFVGGGAWDSLLPAAVPRQAAALHAAAAARGGQLVQLSRPEAEAERDAFESLGCWGRHDAAVARCFNVAALPSIDCSLPFTADVQLASPAECRSAPWEDVYEELLGRSLLAIEHEAPPQRGTEDADPQDGAFRPHSIDLRQSSTGRPARLHGGAVCTDVFEALGARGWGMSSRHGRGQCAGWYKVYTKGLAWRARTAEGPVVLVRDVTIQGGHGQGTTTMQAVAKVYHPRPYRPVRYVQVLLTAATAAAAAADPAVLNRVADDVFAHWKTTARDREPSLWAFAVPGGTAAYTVQWIATPHAAPATVGLRGERTLDVYTVEAAHCVVEHAPRYPCSWDAVAPSDRTTAVLSVDAYDAETVDKYNTDPVPADAGAATVLVFPSLASHAPPPLRSQALHGAGSRLS
eukprot:TRINITY_DN14399_c0_g1_i1.p1 TRINITY_DN14399_c0_g1~~TRINITY_DN14399_c0_g1_i1.p1  ORF type:complete len:1413 (+),score=371.96 TRINITY_DN14399_c0_g1_i1:25-4263(+)